jgi:hypothetical protein
MAKVKVKTRIFVLPLLNSPIYEKFLNRAILYCRSFIREKLAIAYDLATKGVRELPSAIHKQIMDLNKYW